VPLNSSYHFILGSKSPRRKELLAKLDIPFTLLASNAEENVAEGLSPHDIAIHLAEVKANALLDNLSDNDVLITCDTLVAAEGKVLNKPKDSSEAFEMLNTLSDSRHEVYTGVQITAPHSITQFAEATSVFFNPLRKPDIEYYIETYKPFDKAGAYGIQEWIGQIGISRIEGCYYNVMGLPLSRLYEALTLLEK
jgi:septum formation protein